MKPNFKIYIIPKTRFIVFFTLLFDAQILYECTYDKQMDQKKPFSKTKEKGFYGCSVLMA
jgi:hypothetical protein